MIRTNNNNSLLQNSINTEEATNQNTNQDCDLLLSQLPFQKSQNSQPQNQSLTQNFTQININSPVQLNPPSSTLSSRTSDDPLVWMFQKNHDFQRNYFQMQLNQQKMNAMFMKEQFKFKNEILQILKSRHKE